MKSPSSFMLHPYPQPWLGGEPRVLAVNEKNGFLDWPSLEQVRLIDVAYAGGGLSALLDAIASAAGVFNGSLQALLENLEDLCLDQPLVVFVRGGVELLADAGPAVLHLMTGWESYARNGAGVSAMYLVIETGPEALTNAAFYPGGRVAWLPDGR